jgi:hypothetical protein
MYLLNEISIKEIQVVNKPRISATYVTLLSQSPQQAQGMQMQMMQMTPEQQAQQQQMMMQMMQQQQMAAQQQKAAAESNTKVVIGDKSRNSNSNCEFTFRGLSIIIPTSRHIPSIFQSF